MKAEVQLPNSSGKLTRSFARISDWPVLMRLFARNQHRVTADYVSYLLRHHLEETFVYRLDGRIFGVNVLIGGKRPGLAWLEQIVVDTDFRGRGLGKVLMADLETLARARGLTRLESQVHADNLASIAAHEAAGWVRMREEDGKLTYGKPVEAADTVEPMAIRLQGDRLPVKLMRRLAYWAIQSTGLGASIPVMTEDLATLATILPY